MVEPAFNKVTNPKKQYYGCGNELFPELFRIILLQVIVTAAPLIVLTSYFFHIIFLASYFVSAVEGFVTFY